MCNGREKHLSTFVGMLCDIINSMKTEFSCTYCEEKLQNEHTLPSHPHQTAGSLSELTSLHYQIRYFITEIDGCVSNLVIKN